MKKMRKKKETRNRKILKKFGSPQKNKKLKKTKFIVNGKT